jgi:hypothetical protein
MTPGHLTCPWQTKRCEGYQYPLEAAHGLLAGPLASPATAAVATAAFAREILRVGAAGDRPRAGVEDREVAGKMIAEVTDLPGTI